MSIINELLIQQLPVDKTIAEVPVSRRPEFELSSRQFSPSISIPIISTAWHNKRNKRHEILPNN